jgi:RHS repeat-associated protein
VNGKATTTTANIYYEITGATSTKYIYANNLLVATIEGNDIYYVHSDHLTGSNVITNSSGTAVQLLDYYPFGGIRLNERSGNINEKRKAFGHEFDSETDLYFMCSRFQNPAVGRFISQDKAYLSIGNENELIRITGVDLATYLSNPQALNSYSYANNNSLIYKDADGNFAFLIPIAVYIQVTAPVWMPAAITGTAAITAGVATWYNSSALGHLIEGDVKSANSDLNKTEAALGSGAAVITGTMVAGEMLGIGNTSQQKSAKTSNRKNPSTPTGSKGNVLYVKPGTNVAKTINGRNFSGHALDNMQGQGIMPSVVENTIKNYKGIAGKYQGTTVYYNSNNNITVVTDSKSGNIVTVDYGKIKQ